MNERQMRGMIEFHRKAEKAYRAVGKIEDAEMAKRMREELERRLGTAKVAGQ